MLESIPEYRKIVVSRFLIEDDADLLGECGFLENDINHLGLEYKNILLEQNESNLDYSRDEEESLKILNKLMENDINHRS